MSSDVPFSLELPQFFSSQIVDPRSDVVVEFVTIPISSLDRRRGDYPRRFVESLKSNEEYLPRPVGDLGFALSRLIDVALPSRFATSEFDEASYHDERRSYSQALAQNVLDDVRIVYESSPLSVHDASAIVEHLATSSSAYSLNLADGPIVLIEHMGNYVILFATLGVSEGVRRGVAHIIEELFKLKPGKRRKK